MKRMTPEDIDAILPQTQCRLCGYDGCMPYAEALINNAVNINLCQPGGVKTLQKIGEMLQKNPAPFVEEMENNTKPKMLAIIREDECIGCTKCIQACPVDAILGSAKLMHTVIGEECTGCELCVTPCPVDCIDMVKLSEEITREQSNHYRKRYYARSKRLALERAEKQFHQQQLSNNKKKNYIQKAIERAKNKKLSSIPITLRNAK